MVLMMVGWKILMLKGGCGMFRKDEWRRRAHDCRTTTITIAFVLSPPTCRCPLTNNHLQTKKTGARAVRRRPLPRLRPVLQAEGRGLRRGDPPHPGAGGSTKVHVLGLGCVVCVVCVLYICGLLGFEWWWRMSLFVLLLFV